MIHMSAVNNENLGNIGRGDVIMRAHHEIIQRHIFDFRSRPGNRKLEFSRKTDYNPMKNFSRDSGFFRY